MKALGILTKTHKSCSHIKVLNEFLTALKLNQCYMNSVTELLDGCDFTQAKHVPLQ